MAAADAHRGIAKTNAVTAAMFQIARYTVIQPSR
jgi:hypothetical protein